MENLAQQARQGSISAIIQILNERLAEQNIRTRAVLEKGKFQLLCEGEKIEDLEETTIIPQLKTILEEISPITFHKVVIFCRIAKEQQLLWLEELERNPKDLLWTREIKLSRLNLIQKLIKKEPKTRQQKKRELFLENISRQQDPITSSFSVKWIIGGVTSVSLLVIIVLIYQKIQQWKQETTIVATPTPTTSVTPITPPTVPLPPTPKSENPFYDAVKTAMSASQEGQSAKTSQDWLNLAKKWQKASELMKQVPKDHPKYSIAVDRVTQYAQKSQEAQQKAELIEKK